MSSRTLRLVAATDEARTYRMGELEMVVSAPPPGSEPVRIGIRDGNGDHWHVEVHPSDCEWTSEDVDHLDDAILTLQEGTGAIELPGLEHVREKIARKVWG